MNHREQQLLHDTVGDAEPRLCVRSRARIDAGRWWWRSPVWLCVMAEELVMLAVARRRYVEKIAIADCKDTYYNHATGELVIEPGETLRIRCFPIAPRDALRILSLLDSREKLLNTEN